MSIQRLGIPDIRSELGADAIWEDTACSDIPVDVKLMEEGPKLKLVYIAGQYRANSPCEIFDNIMYARKVAMEFNVPGESYAFCPHLNSMLMDGHAPDDFWLQGCIRVLSACDMIVMLPGWQNSSGSKQELSYARHLGIEVVFYPSYPDSDYTE